MTNEEGAYTLPGTALDQNGVTPHLVVSPTYKDPMNGALYMSTRTSFWSELAL